MSGDTKQFLPEQDPECVCYKKGKTHKKRKSFCVLRVFDFSVLRNVRDHAPKYHGYTAAPFDQLGH